MTPERRHRKRIRALRLALELARDPRRRHDILADLIRLQSGEIAPERSSR